MTLEQRVEALEQGRVKDTNSIRILLETCSNLIRGLRSIQHDLANLIADIEADGNSSADRIGNLKTHIGSVSKFAHMLDAKNTAVATVICRELDLDPDEIVEEYKRVVTDFGQVDQLIDETRRSPKET